jgi:hypothetical protein
VGERGDIATLSSVITNIGNISLLRKWTRGNRKKAIGYRQWALDLIAEGKK